MYSLCVDSEGKLTQEYRVQWWVRVLHPVMNLKDKPHPTSVKS